MGMTRLSLTEDNSPAELTKYLLPGGTLLDQLLGGSIIFLYLDSFHDQVIPNSDPLQMISRRSLPQIPVCPHPRFIITHLTQLTHHRHSICALSSSWADIRYNSSSLPW